MLTGGRGIGREQGQGKGEGRGQRGGRRRRVQAARQRPESRRTAPHLNLPGLLTTANRGAQQAAVVAWLLSGEQVSLCPIAAAPAEFERIAGSVLCREYAISKQPALTYVCRQSPVLTTAAAAASTSATITITVATASVTTCGATFAGRLLTQICSSVSSDTLY